MLTRLQPPLATKSPRVYSTLAGYVEVGESLEEAVAREVFEETGITVTRVNYFASQPWPFPANIMLGFHAQTRARSIAIAKNELVGAAWFTVAQIKKFGEYGAGNSDSNSDGGYALPRRDSIARVLIEDWLQRHQ